MRKIVILGFAASLLAGSLPAQAALPNTNSSAARSEAPAAVQAPQANGAPNPNRQICVRDVRSETRIPRQVCHTAREWRDLQENNGED